MLRDLLVSTWRSARPGGRVLPGMFLVVLGMAAAGCAPVSTIEGRARKVRAGEEAIPIEAGSFHFRLAHDGYQGYPLLLAAACALCVVVVPIARSITRRICARFRWWGQPVLIIASSDYFDFGMPFNSPNASVASFLI